MLRVRALSFVHGTLSWCTLAIAFGDPLVPLADAPPPAHAPTPDLLSPPQSLIRSDNDIEGLRLSFGPIVTSCVVQLPFAPVGPDAQ